MSKAQAMRNLHDDLNVVINEIRAILKHYGIADWGEYLLIREPGKAGSYIVEAKESDNSGFAEKLIAFHQAEAASEGAGK